MQHHGVPRSDHAFMHDLIVVRMTTTTYFAEIYSKSAFFNEFDLIFNQKQSILHVKWTVSVEKLELESRRGGINVIKYTLIKHIEHLVFLFF